MKNICEVKGLSFGYSSGKEILSDISIDFKKGEVVGILGKNGCGKTTLLNLITGFLDNYEGSITIKDKNIKSYSNIERAQTLSYIQQNKITIPDYYKVEDFVIEGRRPFRPFGLYTREDYELLDNVMSTCNLTTYRNRLLKEMSGGEVQRCIFARAIMKQSDFFIFDEPCSAMDIKYQKEFFNIAHNIKNSSDATVLLSIHDINLAVNHCDRLIILKGGQKVYDGFAEKVTPEILSDAFDIRVSNECRNLNYFYY